MMTRYTIRRTKEVPPLDDTRHPLWDRAETLHVAHFLKFSMDHRPVTKARLLHNDDGIFVQFVVEDRYVRCVHTTYQDAVCRDACVEWFVTPKPARGYFNFETNCGGAILLHYQEPPKDGKGKADVIAIDSSWAERLRLSHSQPKVVDPEISTPLTWYLAYFVPFALFEHIVGPVDRSGGTVWRANFYKCASNNSHPHWASWSPLGEATSFHTPQCFGEIEFGE